MEDRQQLLQRISAAFNTVCNLEAVDKTKIAAMGFCFGGLCVLDLARAGTDISGVISVHGLLLAPTQVNSANLNAKILALHGHDDPMVPLEQVVAFESEMSEKNADWQLHAYGNTQHAFTNPKANDINLGTIYNEVANKRAFITIEWFLKECFA